MTNHHQVLIIGAGTGGIMAAAQLKKKNSNLSIAIIDPADMHYYQPAWTLVGGGTYDYQKTGRPMKELIPNGVTWIKEKALELLPEDNAVRIESTTVTYDYLIVAPGLVVDPSMIEGLQESLDKGVVCSNYTDPKHTWNVLKSFKGGNALFTQPATPIKCGGAPQKIAYLAADHFKKNNINANVLFATPGTVIFGVKEIRQTLEQVIQRYGIHFKPYHNPIKIDADNKIATFEITDANNACVINEDPDLGITIEGTSRVNIPFDMLHLAPPQRAPQFIADSTLALDTGWLNVDKHTLQSNVHNNVFGLGDVCGLPTAKTGAAIRKQTPIVVANIMRMITENRITQKKYNGYSSCPLVTGYGKMVLAEFDYDKNFIPDPKLKQMLVFNSDKEHWRLWMLKKHMLPYLYWNKMLKGVEV